jgi:hypothetical protein
MIRWLAVLLVITCGGTASQAACAGKITSINAQAPLTYSPFAPWSAHQSLSFTVQNTGSQTCSYQLTIPSRFYPLQFGGKLSFSIASQTSASRGPQAFILLTPAIKSGQSAQFSAVLSVFRGQAVASGTIVSNVGFDLAPAGAAAGQSPIDEVIVPVTCIVPPIFEINLAGSGQYTSVQFGNLAPGQTASVILQTRTTDNHQLEFQSRNGGFLILQGHTGQSSKIPYSLTIDGQEVGLAAATFLHVTAGPGEATHRLAITIDDTAGKLAGTYIDVITVSIESFL